MRRLVVLAALPLVVFALPLGAQQTARAGLQHTPGMQHESPTALPTPAGEVAFAAITEIVKLLQADSTTDWSKVNVEALRRQTPLQSPEFVDSASSA